jgi:hypothetical protein
VNLLSWLLIGGAIAAAALAIEAGNHLVVAVPIGAAAVILISVAGALELAPRSSRFEATHGGAAVQPTTGRLESDSLLRLRRSFGSGKIGRSSILATVRALERDLSPSGRTPLSLDDEQKVLHLPPDQFRGWVDDRLKRIEAAT